MSRLVVVDDSSAAIEYSSPGWAGISGSIPGEVLLDNAIFQTGHLLTANGSLSFSFIGSSIEVFGISSQLHLPSSRIQDPSWQCSVDNIAIPNNNTALRGFPWTSYCSQSNLNDSPHVLTMNITANQTRKFWLDYIRYTPLPNDSLAGKNVIINSTDSALQLTPATDWQKFGTAEIVSTNLNANQETASFEFTFNGTGITWYGLSPNTTFTYGDLFDGARSITEGSAVATLDGVQKSWPVPSLTAPNSSDQSYNTVILNYTSLDATKEHTLSVMYQGSSGTPRPPLSLDFLLIENSPSSTGTNSSTGAAEPPSGSSPLDGGAPSKHKALNVAAVVGGVLGGVLFLLLFLLLVRYLCIGQRRAKYRSKLNTAKSNMVFHPDADDHMFNDTTFNDTDTYAMGSTLRNSDPVRGFSPPKREPFGGSKFVEEMPVLEEGAGSALVRNRTRSPEPARSDTFPQASMSKSVPPSARTSAMLIDYPEAPRSWSTGSPAPSSPANPFRRLTLAGASPSIPPPSVIASFENPSRETVIPPGPQRSNTNPFRVNGGTLTPMSTGRA